MPGELQQKTDRIAAKARIVVERYALIAAQRDEALAKVAELQETVARLERRIASMEQEGMYLRAAMSFAPTREDTARAKALLTEMVREIDLCISELKE